MADDARVVNRQLAQLLRLRVSQLNNCVYCLDLQDQAAREAGIPRANMNVWTRLKHAEGATPGPALVLSGDPGSDQGFARVRSRRPQSTLAPPEVPLDEGGATVSATLGADRFTALPDEQTLTETVTALEEHGFSVDVVDDLDDARTAVLARIPEGSSVMTNTSVTLQETGIADAIDDGGPYDSARNRISDLDYATELPQMKALAGQPDFALGSVHAVTRDGTLVIASASGSQLASYAWGAASVIFVVGTQKLVPDLAAARERIYEHSLELEDARALVTYGQHSRVGKILEIHEEDPGRIHVVLIRRPVGF